MTTTPPLDPAAWLLQELHKTSTATLAESFLMTHLTGEREKTRTSREVAAANFVYDRIVEASEHLDAEYNSVDIPKALACLEQALSVEVREGENIPRDCIIAELLHRLLSHEQALSKRTQPQGATA
jgi:hypothetical protein